MCVEIQPVSVYTRVCFFVFAVDNFKKASDLVLTDEFGSLFGSIFVRWRTCCEFKTVIEVETGALYEIFNGRLYDLTNCKYAIAII